jgi:serine/threonine-protein kinase
MGHDTTPDPDRRTPERPRDASILDVLAKKSGGASRVHLRDAGSADDAPVLDPKARSFQDELTGADRGKYRVLGEIARGGMGIVLRGHDVELGRDVAMKVVHAELADRPEVVARFVEEAQVGGQLQHPGVVPVYELGVMADQRPYFTMKFVKGRTLAAMLARRKSPAEERLRYLGIFEAVCQTMAYAHSKGVIHRDLKPANVMVGSFGEVQVVDWGLSKVLHRGGVADELAAQEQARTVIETVRSGPRSGSDSIVGNVLGTPAYMSPEQARGEIDQLDERTDVFALGAILCEILTGAPPYAGAEGENVLQKAALAELEDARTRIAAAQASEDLKKLCLACLLPSRQARPSSAEELAQAVHGHIAGLESAAHEAQLAAAEQRVAAERSRRRQQLVLSAAALVLVVAGGGWFLDAQRRAREADLERGLDEVRAAVQQEERAGNHERALDEARAGLRLVETGGGGPELVRRARELVASTETALRDAEEQRLAREREEHLLAALADLHMRQMYTGVDVTNAEILAEYRRSFADYGLELTDPDLGPRLLALRDTPLGVQLALGFDGWARVARLVRDTPQDDVQLLTGIGFDLDTDPVRTAVRQALVERDAAALIDTAQSTAIARADPATMFLLGHALSELGEAKLALRTMTTGADLYPSDFALTSGAGLAHFNAGEPLRSIEYLSAALALRPDLALLHSWLGDAQNHSGDLAGSRRSMQRARALTPQGWNMFQITLDSMALGFFEEAERDLGEMRRRRPADIALANLERTCQVYLGQAEFEPYLASCREDSRNALELLLWPAIMLTLVPPPGRALEPARAVELLAIDPRGTEAEAMVPLLLAAASAELGDSAATRAHAARAQALLAPGDRHMRAQALLLAAVGARMLGDDTAADVALAEAQYLRDALVRGREEDWTNSVLVRTFERFEPLVR